ncbi:CASP-like protein F16 [Cucumis melo var. makuwa]|uniref:CASP-like protein F16 n=1 Tax=Cucumis melo var. makuwa TaxID=1194695 RepID=A0A5A7U5Q9_CUCMM|nr:CASP-like protein F16 [Cucumis melo var. makuwa]
MDNKYTNNNRPDLSSSDDSLDSTGMRTADTLLRLVPMGLCIAALIVMLRNSDANDYGSIAYSDLSAFKSSHLKSERFDDDYLGVAHYHHWLSLKTISMNKRCQREATEPFFRLFQSPLEGIRDKELNKEVESSRLPDLR